MRKITYIIIIFLTSCNLTNKSKDKQWNEFPSEINLNSLKQTQFVETLENPIEPEKNIIYTPSFLFAWKKVEEELNSQIKFDDKYSSEFKILMNSNSYTNSLTEKEYSITTKYDNNKITIKAFFNKALPFETKLQMLDKPILFNLRTNVVAFGMNDFDYDIAKFTKILYYKNDKNFVLQLTPKDKEQEIILVKVLSKFETLAQALDLTNSLIEKGKIESLSLEQSWKYEIKENDMFSIPIIKFNIATNYKNLEGLQFITTDNQNHLIKTAYQKTGFILSENGTTVESEAVIIDTAACAEIEPEKEPDIRPKRMVCDNTFLIIIKRKEQKNPYFVMRINNTELMTKK